MTAINTSLSGGYYQLSGSNAQTDTSSTKSVSQTLLDSLSPTASSSSSSAYLLDLSPAAQSYLGSGGTSSSASTSTITGNETFTLNQKQYDQIGAIVAKYKDAPYTQATFNSIQDDLKSAGLDANTLQMKDQAQSFNATGLLVNYLNGNFSAPAGTADSATETSKANNYVKGVLNQWQKSSSTYSASAVSATSSSGSA